VQTALAFWAGEAADSIRGPDARMPNRQNNELSSFMVLVYPSLAIQRQEKRD
jgi:hypothetical protein